MRKVRSKNTGPEVAFRKALWDKGVRYRLHTSKLPGKPDVVLSSKKLAVFIDGDYWHGNQWRARHHASLENQFEHIASRAYWLEKIRRNMQRDCQHTVRLLSEGWTVLRFWESAIRTDLEQCVDATLAVLRNPPQPDARSLVPAKTFAGFFSGTGLTLTGMEKQGWAAERRFRLEDLHERSGEDIPSVTLAAASLSADAFSPVGSRHGASAFREFIRILDEMGDRRPPVILIESEEWRATALALNRLNYTVDPFNVNINQSGARLFIIGVHQYGRLITQDARSPYLFHEHTTRPEPIRDFIINNPEIRWDLRVLPVPPQTGDHPPLVSEHSPTEWNAGDAQPLPGRMSDQSRIIEWVALYYLNPLINELMRGHPLRNP